MASRNALYAAVRRSASMNGSAPLRVTAALYVSIAPCASSRGADAAFSRAPACHSGRSIAANEACGNALATSLGW